jgi:hypothetical protein
MTETITEFVGILIYGGGRVARVLASALVEGAGRLRVVTDQADVVPEPGCKIISLVKPADSE